MTMLDSAPQSQLPLVVMQPNSAIDSKLSAKTLDYLHTIGLPTSEELGFSFTGQMALPPDGVVHFVEAARVFFVDMEQAPEGRKVCLDLLQGELIRWEDDPTNGFINSSAEQFTHSVQAFEYYLEQVQAKGVFGPFYDNTGSTKNRAAYANALADKLRAIDPTVFERGYYWPAFIEEIENGL
ncbi:MAG: hypothetical protein EOO61_20240 [Hymenobacter sp.]|nr:MAG: hypothetical protein EOO61_20240 [Hymenobacter sp.]